MSELLAHSADATEWVEQAISAHSADCNFGDVRGSVIWSDAPGPDGKPIVDIDPLALVAAINGGGFPILLRHDPGFPLGRILAAAIFTTSEGEKFIAAIIGLYSGRRHSFTEFGFDPTIATLCPSQLPAIPSNSWITFATDPREVEQEWVAGVVSTAPMRVERARLSHNAADTSQELIRIGVLFMALVWNPLVTAVATEAGKDLYARIHKWLHTLAERLAERRNPILEIQSHHNGCQISFILRGRNVKGHYAALDTLSVAAAQSELLVERMKHADAAPKLLVYEFELQDEKWFPSYAELHDGRFVTDNKLLIAVEQLPSGLSLGLVLGSDKPCLPNVKK